MTRRKNRNTYVPVTIEAQQPNGEWLLRNSLNSENDEVRSGEKSREWLISMAHRRMHQWQSNMFDGKPLRVSGIPQRVIPSFEPEPTETTFEVDGLEVTLREIILR